MEATKVVPHRIGAFIIDNIIWFAFYVLLIALLGETSSSDSFYSVSVEGGAAAAFFIILIAASIGYWVVLPGLTGWTLGKLALGIRVVKDDGSLPPGVGKSFLRGLMWIADAFPYIFGLYLVALITSLTNDRNKRVGDMVAGTLVVKKQYAGAPLPAATPGFAQVAQGQPAYAGQGAHAGGYAPAAPAPQAGAAAADWYPDPRGEKRLRYWDGSSWTDHTAD